MPPTRREIFDSMVPGMISSLLGGDAAGTGLAFITSQLYRYETKVYEPRRTPLLYQRLVPTDTSDGEGAAGRAYYIMDPRGEVKEIARGSDDLPLSDVAGTDIYIPFKIGGGGYSYDTEDLRQASMLNFNRIALLPQAAFNVYERGLNEHALFGTARWGKLGFPTGLFNSPLIPVVNNATSFDTMTADQMIAFFSAPFDLIYGASHNTSYVNTIALPNYMVSLAQRTKVSDLATETVMSYFMRTNKTTLETGEAITVIGVRGLETAGVGGKPRALFYEKSADNLVLPLPMPYRFLSPQIRNLTFVVPGEFKYGPVHWRYPNTAVYIDSPIDSLSVLPGIVNLPNGMVTDEKRPGNGRAGRGDGRTDAQRADERAQGKEYEAAK